MFLSHPEKKKVSLADLFRPKRSRPPVRKNPQLKQVEVAGGVGYHFINDFQRDTQDSHEELLKTWNAVYCALVLEEFLKELSALSLEHSLLTFDEVHIGS